MLKERKYVFLDELLFNFPKGTKNTISKFADYL